MSLLVTYDSAMPLKSESVMIGTTEAGFINCPKSHRPLQVSVVELRQTAGSSLSDSDSDGMGSISAKPDARKVPLLLCHERFDEASLPANEVILFLHDTRNVVLAINPQQRE